MSEEEEGSEEEVVTLTCLARQISRLQVDNKSLARKLAVTRTDSAEHKAQLTDNNIDFSVKLK